MKDLCKNKMELSVPNLRSNTSPVQTITLCFYKMGIFGLLLTGFINANSAPSAANSVGFPNLPNGVHYSCSNLNHNVGAFGIEKFTFKKIRFFFKNSDEKNYKIFSLLDRRGCRVEVAGTSIKKFEAISAAPRAYGDPIEDNFPPAIPQYIKSIQSLAAAQCKAASADTIPSSSNTYREDCEIDVMGNLYRKGGIAIVWAGESLPFTQVIVLFHDGRILGYGAVGHPDANTENLGYIATFNGAGNGE